MGDSESISSSDPYLVPDAGGDVWAAQTAADGRRGSQRIVQAGEVMAPQTVAALLGLPGGQEVVVRRRIMYLDEEPCELTDTYYPLVIARDTPLAATARIRGGAITLLAQLGYVGVRASENVVARMPTGSERETLRMAPGEPVLQLTRLTRDSADRPIQVDVMAMPSGRQQLSYELRIG